MAIMALVSYFYFVYLQPTKVMKPSSPLLGIYLLIYETFYLTGFEKLKMTKKLNLKE